MSRDFDNIKDINDGKEIWKLAVRLEDLWKSGIGKNEHMEFLILDKQGNNIQVLLPADLCPLWGPKLHEGSTYVMKNFKVQPNDFSVKFCDHSFKLVLVGGEGGSDVIPTKIPNLPNYTLNFKPFSEIKNGNYRSDLLVDVIGAVFEVAAEKRNFSSKKFPTTVSLADSEMNIVTLTLWDKFQAEFLAKYHELEDHQPVIVILKHGKIKEPQGVYDLSIPNAWNGTKLIMDQELPEVKDFIERLPDDFVAQSQLAYTNVETNVIVPHNSMGSQYSNGSRYCFKAPATHISDFYSLPDEEIVTIVATTHHVCISKHGWYYLSCVECPKALITDTPPYKCKIDEHVTPEPVIIYRLEVEVRYEGHKSKFLFWDRECAELIGKTAAELKSIMIEAGDFDPREYPKKLDDMMGKELAFKVKIQSKAKMSNVLTYKSDPEIIAHVKDLLITTENSSQLSLLPTPPDAAGTNSFPIFPIQDLSVTQDSETDSIKTQTPSKRPVGDACNEEPESAKGSSTKIMLRSAIKKEKINHT
ncbi:hypothetical protein P8452_09396 [Trifolium repens]|nr:hypothetical protein P8452_09396 [Trifolium repens]